MPPSVFDERSRPIRARSRQRDGRRLGLAVENACTIHGALRSARCLRSWSHTPRRQHVASRTPSIRRCAATVMRSSLGSLAYIRSPLGTWVTCPCQVGCAPGASPFLCQIFRINEWMLVESGPLERCVSVPMWNPSCDLLGRFLPGACSASVSTTSVRTSHRIRIQVQRRPSAVRGGTRVSWIIWEIKKERRKTEKSRALNADVGNPPSVGSLGRLPRREYRA
jgi:hypothetical protein